MMLPSSLVAIYLACCGKCYVIYYLSFVFGNKKYMA